MDSVDIIKGAREILSDPKRWHQGWYRNASDSAYCILGALGVAHDQDALLLGLAGFEDSPVHEAAQLIAEKAGLSHYDDIPLFNDDGQTIHQDVLNLLDKTLADLGALS